MPQIPGVPTLQPVEKPSMNPRIAGRPGQTIAELGEETQGLAGQELQLQTHIREAQKKVDTLAADNQADALYKQMQSDLAKTQNSSDVPEVIQKYEDGLNELQKNWSRSPAGVEIGLRTEGLRSSMQLHGTMRQTSLLVEEGKIQLAHTGKTLAQEYAQDRGFGGTGDASLSTYYQAVDGLVETGVIGNAQAQQIKEKFREEGQELQIRNAISNPDPRVNQAIYDEINSHPENFPDVTGEHLDILKGHAQEAIKSHIELQDWAEGKMAERTLLPETINLFTDPATKQLDEGKAMAYAAEKLRTGAWTEKQNTAVARGISSYSLQQKAGIQDKTIKADNDIEKLISENKFGQAMEVADSMRTMTENAKMPWYANAGKRIDAARRQKQSEDRAEAHFDEWQNKKDKDTESQANSFQLMQDVASGKVTDQQLTNYLSEGKINYKNYMQLSHLATKIKSEPDTQQALSILYDSLPAPPKTASAADKLEYESLKWNLYQEFDKGVAEKNLKGDDKSKYAAELVKPFVSKDIGDRLDRIMSGDYGKPQLTPMEKVKGVVGTYFNIPAWQFQTAPAARTSAKPAGATGKARGKDGKMHWADASGKDYGLAE